MKAGVTAHHIKGFRPALQAMKDLGIEPSSCLEGTGLCEQDLDSQDSTCTWEQELRFHKNLMDVTCDPCLGLKLANAFQLGTYGLFGYAMLSAPTFRHAMNILESYVQLTYTVCEFKLRVTGNTASLTLNAKYPIQTDLRNMLMDRDTACCKVAFSEALGTQLPLTEVSLFHDGYGCRQQYEDYFGCPVIFNANTDQLSFDAACLDTSLPMRDFQANSVFDQQCKLMLSRLADQGSFIEEIRQKILARPGHSFPDINLLAEKLNISVRTLRRRLSEEGTSYRNIIDEIRFGLAKDYLAQSRLSLDIISELIGYHDAASFSHAFKRWSDGQTPSAWRKNSAE